MIVKDGGEKLRRCLQSAKGVVDEIVVVDTGSSDDSLEVARSLGCRTDEIEWPDAFDEARNHSLSLVETEWVLVLDADEWLAEGAAEALKSAIADDTAAGFLVFCQDLQRDGSFTEMELVRLFRSHPEVRFRGAIHEQIDQSELKRLTGRPNIPRSEVRFFHDGYVEPASDESLRRDVRLLKKELERRPGSLYHECLLASVLTDLGEPEGKVRQRRLVKLLLERAEEPSPPDEQLALILVRELYALGPYEFATNRTASLIEVCYKWFSDYPKVVFAVGEFEIRRQNAPGGLRAFKRLAEMAETGRYSRHTSFPSAILGEALWGPLGILAKVCGERELAKRALLRALEIDPANEAARAHLEGL